MIKEYYKMRILLQFFEQQDTELSVTVLAKMLDLGKTYVSKMLHELAGEGLLDLLDSRHPKLTAAGAEKAGLLSEKVQLNLAQLLRKGIPMQDAMNDAYVIALYCSDATNYIFTAKYRMYLAKKQLQDRASFSGADLCRLLEDGQYKVPFVLYRREKGPEEDFLSMANRGFERPAILHVEAGEGQFTLVGKPLTQYSGVTCSELTGKVASLKYQEDRHFFPCERVADRFLIPASAVQCHTVPTEDLPLVHGMIRLRMSCDVGPIHMPASTAICQFSL